MSQGSQKNYIFVSNNCQHSKRLIGQLQNTTLLQSFQVVNIDDPRVQLPAFVQCVPTLYIPSKRQVLTDSHLFQWFEEAIKVENEDKNKVNMADVTGDASILPFQNSEMGSGLSGSTYSFLEEDKNDLMNQNFSFLQDRDINKMPEFTKFDANTSSSGGKGQAPANKKTGGNTDNAYENMMKSRGSEMQQQRTAPQTPNFNSPY